MCNLYSKKPKLHSIFSLKINCARIYNQQREKVRGVKSVGNQTQASKTLSQRSHTGVTLLSPAKAVTARVNGSHPGKLLRDPVLRVLMWN